MGFRHFEREMRKKGASLPWLLKGTALPGLRRAARWIPGRAASPCTAGQRSVTGAAEQRDDAARDAPCGR